MAKEMKSRGIKEADIALAVGLPLTRFSAERKPFIEYLSKNEFVAFTFENDLYRAHIMNRRLAWLYKGVSSRLVVRLSCFFVRI